MAEQPLLPRAIVIYDGACPLCRQSVAWLKRADRKQQLSFVDYHQEPDLIVIHPDLTLSAAQGRMQVVDPQGRLFAGFFAIRRVCRLLPTLYPWLLLVYFPGSDLFGPACYRWVARHRLKMRRCFGMISKENHCAGGES